MTTHHTTACSYYTDGELCREPPVPGAAGNPRCVSHYLTAGGLCRTCRASVSDCRCPTPAGLPEVPPALFWHRDAPDKPWTLTVRATAPAASVQAADQLAVDDRKRLLRIDARAREELAAETTPPIPAARPGDRFLAEPDTAPTWRIEGLWPAGGNVVLAAQFKAGKTTLRDNLIKSWCDGVPFLGAYPVSPPPGPLAVIDAEMSDNTARRWLKAHSITRAAGFTFVSIRGAAASFNVLAPAIRRQWARMLDGSAALLLDCLGPVLATAGLDENKPADVGRFLAAFEQLLAEAGIRESLVIHHMGHAAERARGASRLRDWPDAEWRLVRQDDDPASQRYLSAFGRDVDVPESRLGYDPGTRLLTLDGGTRKEATAGAILAAMTELLEARPGLSGNQIELALTAEHGRNEVRAAISAAAKSGSIVMQPGPRNSKLHYLSSPVRRSSPPRPGELSPSSSPPFRGGELARSPGDPETTRQGGELDTGNSSGPDTAADPGQTPPLRPCRGCDAPTTGRTPDGRPYCPDGRHINSSEATR